MAEEEEILSFRGGRGEFIAFGSIYTPLEKPRSTGKNEHSPILKKILTITHSHLNLIKVATFMSLGYRSLVKINFTVNLI